MPAFQELLAALPPPDALTSSAVGEEQIRAALARLVVRAIKSGAAGCEPILANPGECPNCGVVVTSTRTPYCSEHCRLMSAFIRQFRNALSTGAAFDVERQVGMGQALWKLQGGGYPLRQRLVTPKALAQIIARHGGVRAVCGGPASAIDHTGSG